jgi:hypothetical protein
MINIVCVLKSNGKIGYDSSWVEKLKNSIQRNITVPYKFLCLSDVDVPCERVELELASEGWWSKLELFRPGILNGPTLYIDLDTVICKNIDEIIDRCKNEKFVMWIEPDTNVHSSAMMYWNGNYSYLWDLYKSKSLDHWKSIYGRPPLYGDQAIVSEHTIHKTFLDICPKEWFHIASKNDTTTNLSNIKILMFRKSHTKPSTMTNHSLVKNHWI